MKRLLPYILCCCTFSSAFDFSTPKLGRGLSSSTVQSYPPECVAELNLYMNFSNWVNHDDYEAMFLSNTWGIMKGMGNYEQCKLHGGSFCLDTVGDQSLCRSSVIAANGCCIPKSCEGSSIEKQVAALFCAPVKEAKGLLNNFTLNTTGGIPILPPAIVTLFEILANLPVVGLGAGKITCGEYSESFTAGSICWILFILILIALVLLASLPKYFEGVYCRDHNTKQVHTQSDSTIHVHHDIPHRGTEVEGEQPTMDKVGSTGGCGMIEDVIIAKQEDTTDKPAHIKILQAFNFQANWTSLVTFVPRKTSFLDGIRFWSFAWVVLGHSVACQGDMGFDNFETIDVHYAPSQLWFTIFENQSGLAIDTFFWLGSFLTGYLLPKKLSEMKVRFCDFWFFAPVLVVRRWLRLMPACLFVLICFWQLFPLMTYGPQGIGQIMKFSADQCSKAWWRYLLNIATVENATADTSFFACQGWYWYFVTEMYMYCIAVIIVAFYILNRNIAIGMSAFCTLLFTIIAWNQAYVTQQSYPPFYWPDPNTSAEGGAYHVRFWNRAGVYFVGLTVGFIFRELDAKKHKIGACVSSLLQLFSCLLLFLICSILFTNITRPKKGYLWYHLVGNASWTNMGWAAYLGLARPAWGIGLSILSYSFIYNEGGKGCFNRMLSLPVYSPLAKLSFVGYLIHLDWIQLYGATQAGLWEHYTTVSQVRNFLGYICMALLSAFVIAMICELPFAKLERLLFDVGGFKCRNQKLTNNGVQNQQKVALLHD